jgi:hypothetical protein
MKTYTLHVETLEDNPGIWLCLDNGFEAIPIAKFVSEQAAEDYKRAVALAFAKSHEMGRSGF